MVFCQYMMKCNLFLQSKLNFQYHYSEINIDIQLIMVIIIAVQNSFHCFISLWKLWYIFKGFFDE